MNNDYNSSESEARDLVYRRTVRNGVTENADTMPKGMEIWKCGIISSYRNTVELKCCRGCELIASTNFDGREEELDH